MAGIQRNFRVGNMWKPTIPMALPYIFDFGLTAQASQLLDIELNQVSHGLDFVQTIYVRNTDNAAVLTLTFPGGQQIDIPAGASGYWPVAAEWGKFTVTAATTLAADLIVDVLLMNVPVGAQSWGPVTVNVAAVNANFTPVQKNAAQTKFVLTGGDDTILAANGARTRVRIYSAANNAAPVAYNWNAAAVLADNMRLLPDEIYDSATGPVDARAIHAIGTAGDILIIEEQ